MSGPWMDPDELRWLQAQVGRYTYMPETRFRVLPALGSFDLHRVRISTPRLDSNGTGRITPVSGDFAMPWYFVENRDEERLARWVADVLKDLEVHESQEWFRVDGVRHDDPHAGGKT